MADQSKAPFLPYGRQVIENDDIEAVTQILRGDWLTTGPTVEAFELALAEKVGAKFTVCCSSGTAALHLAMLAMEVGAGDTVIVPSLTFAATANAARFVGADVVFADVDPETGLMTGKTLQAAIDESRDAKPRAVLPVHLNGQCAEPEAISEIAGRNGIEIVEDACHALGTSYLTSDGVECRVGQCQHGDATVFSFHPVKTIAMAEGGAISTNDEKFAARLKRFRSHGLSRDAASFVNSELAFDFEGKPNPWYYEIADLGFNYRLGDINCALGLSQLKKIDRFIARRREITQRYDDGLERLRPTVMPIRREPNMMPAWHLYPVLIDFEHLPIDRADLMNELARRGVGSQVHYIPLHMQAHFQTDKSKRRNAGGLPGAEAYYQKVLSLPLFPSLTNADVDRVIESLGAIIGDR
jgi:UDP-4-amino-4,6-dideoxy-N-acetyl-beta-L-altrosamine transaminase